MQMDNHFRRIIFASGLNYVVRPYRVRLIPAFSVFNEECNTVENNYMEMMPLLNMLNVVTGDYKTITKS